MMMFSLALLCVAAAAIVSYAVSALAGLALVVGKRALESRSPAARARVLLGLALLPLFVTVAVMAAALAPSFGWIADHCTPVADPHGHPHICMHHESVFPALPIAVLAGVLALRCLEAVARLIVLGVSALRVRRRLLGEASGARAGDASVLPIDEPHAFVLGVVRPTLFVTRGLLAGEHRPHLDAVLAHERAHVRRGDPMRRVVARVAFAFHVPGVAMAIERRLARAHEMAADEDAATSVGSRPRVARALVHLARARMRVPHGALAFAGCDVEARVCSLLEPRPRRPGPAPRTIAGIAGLALVAIAGGADSVHHGIELILGLLGV